MRIPRHLKGRLGYTTGACATAALKAALLALFKDKRPSQVEILLPVGLEATFSIHQLEKAEGYACASVIKDAGDDPDVTHGAEIKVCVSIRPGEGKRFFLAGEGVGIVTKPGLGLPLGAPAITKVPQKMMTQVIDEILGERKDLYDLEVTISIPNGETLAQKTLNPRLGIKGGLSILGTKGVVIPFSTAAYKATIAKALRVARAQGLKTVVLTTGGRSEAFCQRLLPHLSEEALVQVGDYLGFSLRLASLLGFEEIILGMMVGKMAKLAAGLSHTHASAGEVPLGLLEALAQRAGCKREIQGVDIKTARGFLEVIKKEAPYRVKNFGYLLCREATREAQRMIKKAVLIRTLLLDFDGSLIASFSHDPSHRC